MGAPRVPQFAASPTRDPRKSKPNHRKTPIGRPDAGELLRGSDAPPAPDRSVAPWLAKARSLAAALAEAERTGVASTTLQMCIERAYAAWNLDGASPRNVARIAHLVQRAHEAIRNTSRAGLEGAYADCARVVHLGLPSAIKRKVDLDVVIDLVRAMRKEGDAWIAVVESTMVLLGWRDAARTRAADAIRQALTEFPPDSLDGA